MSCIDDNKKFVVGGYASCIDMERLLCVDCINENQIVDATTYKVQAKGFAKHWPLRLSNSKILLSPIHKGMFFF
jgi:hypothetical protein